jgi:hypothetical protein
MTLDVYADCFSRIFNFRPSIAACMTWEEVGNYKEKHMKVKRTTEEPIYFDRYDPEA